MMCVEVMKQPNDVNVTGHHGGSWEESQAVERDPKLPRRDSTLPGRDSKLLERVQSDLDSSH